MIKIKNPVISNCQTCKKEISHFPYEIRKFCSHNCQRKPLKRITLICKNCNNKFQCYPYEHAKQFCGIKCRGEAFSPTEIQRIKARETIIKWNKDNPTDPAKARAWALARDPNTRVRGDKHHFWKGGYKIDGCGYKRILISPKKYKPEHRIIMEKHLGRELNKEEHVHHINHDRLDNRIENLHLFKNAREHALHHWASGKKHK